jgi:hypothetical protein
MVKNTNGGNKSKGFARKNLTKTVTSLRVAKEDGEVYAQAVKIMGGCFASVIDIDGLPMRGHIRGKFRGRGKRDNFIGANTWLLVGLHEWEAGGKTKPDDIRNCDILEVYNDADKNRLKNLVTSVDWSKFILNDTKALSATNEVIQGDPNAGILFTDDATQEYEELIAAQIGDGKQKTIIINDGAMVDVDDI